MITSPQSGQFDEAIHQYPSVPEAIDDPVRECSGMWNDTKQWGHFIEPGSTVVMVVSLVIGWAPAILEHGGHT